MRKLSNWIKSSGLRIVFVLLAITLANNNVCLAADDIDRQIQSNLKKIEFLRTQYLRYQKVTENPNIWLLPLGPFIFMGGAQNKNEVIKWLTFIHSTNAFDKGKKFDKDQFKDQLAYAIKMYRDTSNTIKAQYRKDMIEIQTEIHKLESTTKILQKKQKADMHGKKSTKGSDAHGSMFTIEPMTTKDKKMFGGGAGK